MALKRPSQQATQNRVVTEEEAEALADKLADKPYGSMPQGPEKKSMSVLDEVMTRTTISLPDSMLILMEDMARQNKRQGVDPKTVSGIVREAFLLYHNKNLPPSSRG